jgi:hypothetical protein
VLLVLGVDYELSKLPSGERCSAMFVSALTKRAGDSAHIIVSQLKNILS